LDISTSAINYALKEFSSSKCRFQVADLTSPSLTEQFQDRFDLLVSFDVIEHVEKYWQFVNNAKKFLKPGGTALVGCPNRLATLRINREWNRFHVQEFTPCQLHWVLNAAFDEVKIIGQDVVNADKSLPDVSRDGKLKVALYSLVKAISPNVIIDLLRKLRFKMPNSKGGVPASCYNRNDIGFFEISLSDNSATEKPFGLIGICK